MNLGKGFIVTVPNEDSEERLLALLKQRRENYSIVIRDPDSRVWTHWGEFELKYPANWLISSMDDAILNLGLVIREANKDDLKAILPIQFR